jgi:hypothetical protein
VGVVLGESFREYSARLVAHEKGEHEGGRKGSRISPQDRIIRFQSPRRMFSRHFPCEKQAHARVAELVLVSNAKGCTGTSLYKYLYVATTPG